MDPHKDFIHIDDLFKDLRNGEEQERSGSWLHMKDLLDKEMPLGTTSSGGRSFRRYIIPLLASLLLIGGGGGVAYYKLNETGKNTAALASGNNNVGLNASGGDASRNLLASGNNLTSPERKEKSRDANTIPAVARGHNNGYSASASGIKGHTEATPSGNKAADHSIIGTTHQRNPAGGKHILSGKPGRKLPGSAPGQDHKAIAGQMNKKQTGAAQEHLSPAASQIMEEQHVIEEIKPLPSAAAKHNNTFASRTSVVSGGADKTETTAGAHNKNLKHLALSLNDKKIVKDAEGTLYKEERDTFKRIDLVERVVAGNNYASGNKSFRTVLDTVAVTRVEKIRYVPLDPLELGTLRKMGIEASTRKLVPMSNLHARVLSKEMVSLVPLNKYKVASRRVDPGKFNQLVQNTSQGIANYFDGSRNFYAAIILGGNTSFGNPGAFGMQLGIAGLYSLGERLTLAAELKYANHYFSNYTVEDKSVTFENITSQQLGAEWLFAGKQNTVTSAYKINSYGALEVPVTLNYNLGRVSIFAGLNMAYAFPIKWSKQNTLNTTDVQQTRNQNQNPFLNSSFKVDEQKDFASRLGLGYVWGLNYDLSRKVSIDARLTQILWDNSKSNADAISRLFHTPAMQFSIGYYFGRKEKIVYIMDKR